MSSKVHAALRAEITPLIESWGYEEIIQCLIDDMDGCIRDSHEDPGDYIEFCELIYGETIRHLQAAIKELND